MSNVRKIVCHAEFNCTRCGLPYTCMALAPWDDQHGVMGDGKRSGRDICNDCDQSEREVEREAYNKSRRQRAWAKRAEKFAQPKGKR